MGFLNENDSLAYFDILEGLLAGLSWAFSKLLVFWRCELAFSRRQEEHTSQHPDLLVGLKRPNIREEFSWLSVQNSKDIPFNSYSFKVLDKVIH